MRTIEIDDEVFAYVQSKAIPYVEKSPNHTLRRLFGLDSSNETPQRESPTVVTRPSTGRKKQPRTDLKQLIRAGLLQRGQTLYLHDYQGARIPGYEAHISGKELSWNEQEYSMSDLARRFLQKVGYESDSVRGPAHWYTADAVSVKDLWKQFLNGRGSWSK